jgi:two-component system, LytTR family, response regulator
MTTTFRMAEFSNQELARFDDIVCLIGDRNYTQIWLRDGRCVVASKTLELLQQSLNANFVRIHKRHIVNKSFVKKTGRGFSYLHLQDGRVLAVARRRLHATRLVFKQSI